MLLITKNYSKYIIMLHPKLKRNIIRIIPFGLIWLVLGLIFSAIEAAAIHDLQYRNELVIHISFTVFVFAMLFITLGGLTIGAFELLYIRSFFANRSLKVKMIGKFIIYLAFLFVLVTIAYPIAAHLESGYGVFSKEIWVRFIEFIKSTTFLSTALQLGVSLVATLFYVEVSDSLGPNVFIDFVTGKYHKPNQENRIFMFVDMKSSTTIAEQLGHNSYFYFLKDYFRILSDVLIEYAAEIYQYVGDEIIVTWKLKNGIDNNSCINCFFEMKKAITKNETLFLKKYNVMPDFKAGLHYGEVTTGEIGHVKRNIIFTGDVLNASARIQSLCNHYNSDILISDDLIQVLDLKDSYSITSMGITQLRGKSEDMELFTIHPL